MPNITTEFVNEKRSPGEYRDGKLPGFVLRISDTGVRSYQVQGRIKGGRILRYTIGKHGVPWTAKQAREEAEKILYLMKIGIDPRVEKREQQQEQAAKLAQSKADDLKRKLTIRLVFEAWFVDERKTKPSTKKLYREVMYKHLRDWLDKPMCELTPDMISKRYNTISDQTVASANNCFRALRRLYNWAILEYDDGAGQSILSSNPVSVLAKRKKWIKLRPRDNMIADEDLKPWFKAVLGLTDATFRDYFILTLVTGLRKIESASLKWEDVNFKRSIFTARDTKNGRDHVVPMTDYVRSLFKSREAERGKSPYVFPHDNVRGHIYDVRRSQEEIISASGVKFAPHGLRRTFSYAAAKVRLGDSERKALLNQLANSDVTDAHYSPWQIEDLREPIALVERYILVRAGVVSESQTLFEAPAVR